MGKILHQITDTLRAICGAKNRIEPTSAIIVASGSSTRMGQGVSKQMILLDDIPVVARTIMAFDNCEYISEIIVVAKEDADQALEILRANGEDPYVIGNIVASDSKIILE